MDIDSFINLAFKSLADVSEMFIFYTIDIQAGADTVSVPLILLWLACASVFFTLYLGFINIRYFKHGLQVLMGKYDESGEDGEIGNWQALAASLSGTVGLGNIAGVAVAVSVGGPGAVFWMVIMGILGMATKFVEVMLGVKYRHHVDKENPDKISGGPMYYLRDGFANRGWGKTGAVLGAFFAIACIGGAIGGGNMFQANQSYQQLLSVTGGDASFLADKGWLFGLGLAFLVGIVIIGGVKSIANVSSSLVPVMGGIYLLVGLIIIGMNADKVPHAFGVIFTEAFSPVAVTGGVLGTILMGVQRASFSNEAGLGSAAIIYSAVKTNKPVAQGFVGMLGPFIDTVIICLVTALMIVITGVYQDGVGMEGVELTSRAMGDQISWMPYVLALTVFLFAYSTLITWAYYGERCLTYLFGEKDWIEYIFKFVFCGFVVVGASSDLTNVIRFSDAMIFSMAIPNIIGLYWFAPEVKRDIKNYIQSLDKK